jgi:hypothetical protein
LETTCKYDARLQPSAIETDRETWKPEKWTRFGTSKHGDGFVALNHRAGRKKHGKDVQVNSHSLFEVIIAVFGWRD